MGSEDKRQGGIYAWLVVTLLALCFAFSMVDRMVLSLLVTPLKASYGYSDVEISLLQGLAFTLFYITCGLPIGWLVDRYRRTSIISWCVLIWSAMTMGCAFTRDFLTLFLARAGVGVGEAGLAPSANSLISDYFPPDRLAKPVALYASGSLYGPALALIAGGPIIDYLLKLGSIDIFLLGSWPAWQLTFVIAGIPGILLAFIFRFIKEPPRHGRSAKSRGSVQETLVYLRKQRGFLIPHIAGASLTSLSLIAFLFWLPTFIVRVHGYSPGEAARIYGVVSLVTGLGGLAFASFAADILSRRGVRGSHILILIFLGGAAVLPLIAAMCVPDPLVFFILIGLGIFLASPILSLAPVALQIFVPNEKRGQVYALYLFASAGLGYALGPFITAFITERLLGDSNQIGLSLAITAGLFLPVAPLCFFLSLRQYRAAGFA